MTTPPEASETGPAFFAEQQYAVLHDAVAAADAKRYLAYALLMRQHPHHYAEDARYPALFRYADVIGESLLRNLQPSVEALTGLALLPCFSKLGVYSAPASSAPRTELPAREIGVLLGLGGAVPNRWPVWFRTESGPVSVDIAPGVLVVYRGAELEHWRTALHAETWVELDLQYVTADGEHIHHRFDGRRGLGEPQNRLQQDECIRLRKEYDAALAAGEDRPCFCGNGQRYSACHGLMRQALQA